MPKLASLRQARRAMRQLTDLVAIAVLTFAALASSLVYPGRAAADPSPAPPVTGGLQLWFEASLESYSDGAAVMRWSDESGFGRDLTAGSASAAPTFRANAINGRSAIEFDGVRSLMKTYGSRFTLSQPTTFFVVYRSLDPDSNAGRDFVFDSTNSSVRQAFGRPAAGTIRMYANSDLDFGGITYPFSGFGIWSGVFDGLSSSLYENGSLIGGGYSGFAGLEGLTVGGLNSAGQDGYDLSHSLVAEVLYYSGALSDGDRATIETWLNQKYGLDAPPSNTGAPSISGDTTVGHTLSASNGSWSGAQPISFSYQWQRCTAVGPGSCRNIDGATNSTYTPASTDAGSQLEVSVTGSNLAGSATATSSPTDTITAPAPTPPRNTSPPSISGTDAVDATLTSSNGTWAGTSPITYAQQWETCDSVGGNCADIAGATGQTYVVQSTDAGKMLRVRVTASNREGSATASSDATGVVGTGPPVTGGLQLWFEASLESYSDGAAVMRWSDESGFGRNLTAGSASAAPTFRANAINGRSAIEFDGVRSLMKTYGSRFTLSQPTTFFVVYRSLDPDSNAGRDFVFDSTNSSVRQAFGRPAAGTIRMYANSDLDFGGITYPFSGFGIWSGVFDGLSSSLYENGSLIGGGYSGFAGLEGLTVGGLNSAGQDGYDLSHSLVAEVLYYSGALSDGDRATIEKWLNQKYGL